MKLECPFSCDDDTADIDISRISLAALVKPFRAPSRFVREKEKKLAESQANTITLISQVKTDDESHAGYSRNIRKDFTGSQILTPNHQKGIIPMVGCAYEGQNLFKLPIEKHFLPNQLQIFDLSENKLSKFPLEVLQMTSIQELKIDHNQIPSIPREVIQLANLNTLTASYNDINKIDRSLGKLDKLQVLSLDNNKLEEWPEWICCDLWKLRRLHLHGNVNIPGIPLTFYKMTELEQLSFHWFEYLKPAKGIKIDGENSFFVQLRTMCKRIIQITEILPKKSENKNPGKYCTFLKFFEEFVLKHKARLDSTIHIYNKQRSPLHIACKRGHRMVVKEFIDKGYNLNTVDNLNYTPLILALQHQKIECVKLLLDCPHTNVTIGAKNGTQPLHISISSGRFDIAELIAGHASVNVNAKDTNGNTPLHLLFQTCDFFPQLSIKVCNSIINNPKCNVNVLNNELLTPLHLAARAHQKQAIRFAIEHNKRKNKSCNKGQLFNLSAVCGKKKRSLLHDIALNYDAETLSDFLRNSVNVFAIDKKGRTARNLINNSVSSKLLRKLEQQVIRKKIKIPLEQYNTPISREIKCSIKYNKPFKSFILPSSINSKKATLTKKNNEQPSPKKFNINKDLKIYLLKKGDHFEVSSESKITRKYSDTSENSTFEKENNFENIVQPILTSSLIPSYNHLQCGNPFIRMKTMEEKKGILPNVTKGKFGKLIRLILKSDLRVSLKLKIAYYIFSQKSPESEEMLMLLNGLLANSNPLKNEIEHLLEVIKSIRQMQKISVDQKYNLKREKNIQSVCFPGIKKTKNSSKVMTKSFINQFDNGIENNTYSVSDNPTQESELNCSIPNFQVKKARSYFNVNVH